MERYLFTPSDPGLTLSLLDLSHSIFKNFNWFIVICTYSWNAMWLFQYMYTMYDDDLMFRGYSFKPQILLPSLKQFPLSLNRTTLKGFLFVLCSIFKNLCPRSRSTCLQMSVLPFNSDINLGKFHDSVVSPFHFQDALNFDLIKNNALWIKIFQVTYLLDKNRCIW